MRRYNEWVGSWKFAKNQAKASNYPIRENIWFSRTLLIIDFKEKKTTLIHRENKEEKSYAFKRNDENRAKSLITIFSYIIATGWSIVWSWGNMLSTNTAYWVTYSQDRIGLREIGTITLLYSFICQNTVCLYCTVVNSVFWFYMPSV